MNKVPGGYHVLWGTALFWTLLCFFYLLILDIGAGRWECVGNKTTCTSYDPVDCRVYYGNNCTIEWDIGKCTSQETKCVRRLWTWRS